MSVASLRWVRPPSGLIARIGTWWRGVDGQVQALLADYAQRLTAHAQATHPWQNLTGAAEAGLHAWVEKTGEGYRLTLAHGVDYGVWLEVRWGGKYAVILPTLEAYQGEIMAAIQGVIR